MTTIYAAGIFASENGQRLLHILEKLTHRGFEGLYARCKDDLQCDYYQTGLQRVGVWSSDVIREDIDFVCETCPDFEETFESCFVQYVQDRYRGQRRATVRTPPMVEFVRSFLESMGQHEALATGDYFAKRDSMQQRLSCMDSARQAMFALVKTEHVRVELASEVSAVKPTHRTLHEDDVHPNDSISNVGYSFQHTDQPILEGDDSRPLSRGLYPTQAPSQAPSSQASHAQSQARPVVAPPSQVSHAQSQARPVAAPPSQVSHAQSQARPVAGPPSQVSHAQSQARPVAAPPSQVSHAGPVAAPPSQVSHVSQARRAPSQVSHAQSSAPSGDPPTEPPPVWQERPPTPPPLEYQVAVATSPPSSVTSRHDFRQEDFSVPSKPPVAHSRDSSVSIQMKRASSPKPRR